MFTIFIQLYIYTHPIKRMLNYERKYLFFLLNMCIKLSINNNTTNNSVMYISNDKDSMIINEMFF